MKELFLEGLSVAYAFAGIVCCIAYFPTIKDLYFRKKASANTITYLLWTITALITLLYSMFVLSDTIFRVFSVANFALCFIILQMSLTNLKRNRQRC